MSNIISKAPQKQSLWNLVTFLEGSTHLYMRACPYVGRMDGWSVRNRFFSNAKNGKFSLGKLSGQSKFDIAECAECSECA